MIEVPYWWDFQKESLAATIRQIRYKCFQMGTFLHSNLRHDIIMIAATGAPISQEMPDEPFYKGNYSGEKQNQICLGDDNTLPLSLAENWNYSKNLTGW